MPAESPITSRAAEELAVLRAAHQRGPIATLGAWLRLSGPGWLQSAITLGGGTLASSLYLGVLAGFSMLWLQPLAMLLGIVMLSAIGHVTLTTGERPFLTVTRDVNPVLGWGWALASLAANMVWALPQYALATSVVQQNLLPEAFGASGPLGETGGKIAIAAAILAVSIAVTWSYDRGGRGVRLYERMLKVLVAVVVVSFFGVVVRLTTANGLDWGAIAAGFVPDLGAFDRPAVTYEPWLERLDGGARAFWSEQIVGMQRDVMISAAATAVGINMTFLLPYSLLQRGWNREFRGFARFDLAGGMLIPFLLATSCVVVASASRFHTQPVPGILATTDGAPAATPRAVGEFTATCGARVRARDGITMAAWTALPPAERATLCADLPEAEREIAAMLAKRDAFDLAKALEPLTGRLFGNVVFGIGVLGMALSTITLLMLISGFVISEMLGLPPGGRAHRVGTLAAATGALGPFVWSDAAFYLAVPTSLFGMALLPIAYWTFFLMLNSSRVLGADRPRGRARVAWNALMIPAALLATVASLWSIWSGARAAGLTFLGVFLSAAAVVHLLRTRASRAG